jgi:site-specific DNA-cytosine methylase
MRHGSRGGVCPTLNAFDNATETRATVIAFGHTQGLDIQPSTTEFPTLRVGGNGAATSGPGGVRRLTPVECERLQGFPDDWAAGQADSPRYRQLGNAVAVPVAEYVGWLLMQEIMQHDTAGA